MNRIEGTRLCYTDRQGRDREVTLSETAPRVIVGRSPRSDIVLSWDSMVSRLHAVIEWTGTYWAVVDDGLSRNGTFVNSERLTGRRRLRSGDVIWIGATKLTFRGEDSPGCEQTRVHRFIKALTEARIIFDAEAAHDYLSARAATAPEQTTMRLAENSLCTDERLKQEAHELADRFHGSMPGTADRDYYAFTQTSTDDLLEDISLSMIVMQEADATGALPAALPFSGLAHKFASIVRELSTALAVDPLPHSTHGFIGYVFIEGNVIDTMASFFEAVGTLLLDHGYRPILVPRGEDSLMLATKAITHASALRSTRR
ncbi:FHA domain-containing protein [Rhodococcus opacus]|uniref:FHA domain-containing protein n=2 Tax=Rhodococcus TaxID=1827 RepID=UPI002475C281|nr:FHA domain-containing protein [Rhodococcus opacus]